MLTDQDILKLKSVLATKENFQEIKDDTLEIKGDVSFLKRDSKELKSEMADLRELVQGLIVSTDGIAKAIGNLSIEYSAISTQLSRHELWIKQIAEKVGLKLVTD
jgi:soluble cytochrome b562